MSIPIRAFIALGSNLEDPEFQVMRAFEDLAMLPSTALVAHSSLYVSAPVGNVQQPDFVNAVAEISTALPPRTLLDALFEIEHRYGRIRDLSGSGHGSPPNLPRTLDLDLLLYADLKLHQHGLTLPHPRMQQRAFVLHPLLEIEPGCVIPGLGLAADFLPGCGAQSIRRLEG